MPTYTDIPKPSSLAYSDVSKPTGLAVADNDYLFQDGQQFLFQDAIQYIFSTSSQTIYEDIVRTAAPIYQEVVRPT